MATATPNPQAELYENIGRMAVDSLGVDPETAKASDFAELLNKPSKRPESRQVYWLQDPHRYQVVKDLAASLAATDSLPDHLVVFRGADGSRVVDESRTAQNCLRVALLALCNDLSPWEVADHMYRVPSKEGGLGPIQYDGILVAAILANSGWLRTPLDYRFEGEDKSRKCIAFATFRWEQTKREAGRTFESVNALANAAASKAFLAADPDQKLVYSASRAWGKTHAPSLLLGGAAPDSTQGMATIQSGRVDTAFSKPAPVEPDPIASEAEDREATEPEGLDCDLVDSALAQAGTIGQLEIALGILLQTCSTPDESQWLQDQGAKRRRELIEAPAFDWAAARKEADGAETEDELAITFRILEDRLKTPEDIEQLRKMFGARRKAILQNNN